MQRTGTRSKGESKSDQLAALLAGAHQLASRGDLAGAAARLGDATSRFPAAPEAWSMYGDVLYGAGQVDSALAAYQRAAGLDAVPANAHQRLAEAALAAGRWELAAATLATLLATRRDSLNQARLGICLQTLGRCDEAVTQYEAALQDAAPGLAYTLHLNAGACLHQLQSYAAAAGHAEAAALVAGSDDQRAVARRNAGSARLEAGDVVGARADFANNPRAASSALYASNFATPYDPLAVLAEHRRWGEAAIAAAAAEAGADLAAGADAAAAPPRWATGAADPQRPLSIGFVSADFRQHPVAFFVEGLLAELPKLGCRTVLYSDVVAPDDVSARLRTAAGAWVDCAGLDNAQLGARVAADGIDVLVDLAGHTSERIAFFTRRRAPLQVEYLGYAATTGLATFDAFLSDELLDPIGDGNTFFVEPLIRLPRSSVTYTPPPDAPDLAPSPFLVTARLTFGSFNRPHKLNAATLDLWAQVLTALPESRLLIVGKGFAEPTQRAPIVDRLASRGVAPDRLAWRGQLGFADYLACHAEVDVLLDCLPWSGHTVTAHAAWMGVPTLTLAAGHHAGRFSAALMQLLGLADWIAASPADLVARAQDIAADPARLASLRAGLRGRFATSPLGDHAALARSFVAALRGLLAQRAGQARSER